MPEWLGSVLGPGIGGAFIAGVVAIVVAAINKRRTAPERKLDALDGALRLVQDLQEERDTADQRTRDARSEAAEERQRLRDDLAEERAAHAATKAAHDVERASTVTRERIKDAYIEVLRAHITQGFPPPPPDYPEGI
ncbi:hypothetical protein [Agrococcus sp. Marseille-Q4369]|uniref:hypothetical protein n=1 Tax=Agrococcus sp. Marseille-Q4369 TaxID=2810513 RepID=UPI001B8B11F2|nr:hypothetical protein [Agrococcus sp. Marseille-Q4369]QUW18903.1 hypothetical protein JSQ78_00515 [Agrococcus sp. Marseille-Q4369]